MKLKHWVLAGVAAIAVFAAIKALSDEDGTVTIAQQPLFTKSSLPPLNMLVMGKDHKIYYEAYNDASDLNGDGIPDVGYKPEIDYYGYFNSHSCYAWSVNYFTPQSTTPDKTCGGTTWSGDFLNYLTTSRMDALRRVLYGGWRQTDGADGLTILQGAFFPQDGHSWGKEYQSIERDHYDIRKYSPLDLPKAGKYHLFAVTTTSGNGQAAPNYTAPLFRVMQNSDFRVWNWLSIEGPVAGNKCFTANNDRVDCVGGSNTWQLVPGASLSGLQLTIWKLVNQNGSPGDRATMNQWFNTHAVPGNVCGSRPETQINKANGNPWSGTNGCGNDHFISRVSGTLTVASDGDYVFAVDGDDAVDLTIDGTAVVGWYGGHASDHSDNGLNSHKATIHLSAGAHTIMFRHQEDGGDDSFGLFWQNMSGATTRTDYQVRVQACKEDESGTLLESVCRSYPNGHYKPTGILHDYGMTQRMYFGLITGSQFNNLEGGVLRRNINNFAEEINPNTGQIRTDVSGIVHNLDGLRMIGGGYDGDVTDNSNNDKNWNWANGTGNCPSIGGRAINDGECRMWGNPIAEMMYESMRYFAGASQPTTRFATGGASEGRTEENTMGLKTEAWKNPYGSDGYSMCSRPYQTIISDINPSYDGDLPGSGFGDAVTTVNDTPAMINGFNASSEGQAVWNAEGLGTTPVFIGEAGGFTDGAPTAKSASSFGNIRGLAPEEPTKGGTYYAASVARYGRMTDINSVGGKQNLVTYSIALASPLPRIEFPIGGKTITILPFGKTVSGTFGETSRKPTNSIVDFYIDWDNTVYDASGNLVKARFRINYEDVEQGNDYDMDAIVLYDITTSGNTVTVKLTSEYAAGSANQNLGYVISGTDHDGVYLAVRDKDSVQKNSVYELNTPNGIYAGGCVGKTDTSPCNEGLGFESTHTFSVVADSVSGKQLKDPLWYAAKYGGPNSQNGGAGDVDANGDPTNYFLVSNALNLRSQLSKAFDSIENQQGNSGSISISGAQVGRPSNSYVVIPSYASGNNGHDWTGDLVRKEVGEDGLPVANATWNAAAKLKDQAGSRNMWTALSDVDNVNRSTAVKEFTTQTLVNEQGITFDKFGYNTSQVTNLFGSSITVSNMIDYLRGDQAMEGNALNSKPFRVRSSVLGDIVNSEPVLSTSRSNFGWSLASGLPDAARDAYADYVAGKSEKREFAFVGANDGMLHAFDTTDGEEKFAYIPNGVFGNLGLLAEGEADGVNAGYTHHFYVDGKLTVADAYNGSWKTLLAGATGAGGRSVFGLDVTNPAAFNAQKVLWEVTGAKYPELGYVMGKPLVVPLQNGRWVALFGNGYNSEAGKDADTHHEKGDAALFVVDAFTGEVLKIITPHDGSSAANGLGNIAVLDTNYDGLIDTVYGGDLLGNMWKFDLSGAKSDWDVAYGGKPLFQTRDRKGDPQPITGSLEVAIGPGDGYMVYFGTGRYFAAGDNDPKAKTSQQVQSFYAVWDNGTAGTVLRSNLVQQSISGRVLTKTDENGVTIDGYTTIRNSQVSYLSNRGWFIDLVVGTDTDIGLGERFVSRPAIRDGVILFDTYQPGGSDDDCNPGGLNFRYGLNLMTGAPALPSARDEHGNPVPNTGGGQLESGAPSMGPGSTYPATDYPPVYCELDEDGKCKEDGGGGGSLKCSIVILDPGNPGKSIAKQRPCGRQSWRQLR